MWKWVAILVVVVAADQFIVRIGPDATSGVVTNSSNISWDLADLTDLMGFTVKVDNNTPIDVGMPTTQAPLGGGGITFTIPVTTLSLTNGAHTLTICAYNSGGTSSSNCPTLQVTKQ